MVKIGKTVRTKISHWGTSLDTFLSEDGIREAAKTEAMTRVVAWQLTQEMERQGMTKATLEKMYPGRVQIDEGGQGE